MHKYFYKLVSFVIWICLAFTLSGQQQEIVGKITDADNGEEILGATILLKGTSIGTVSDFDGSYSIKVDDLSDTLAISYIGYKDLIIPISGRSQIDIALEINSNELDEVIVVGYGRQKKKVVTGATSRVGSEEINSTPVLRVEQALQGRTPGVQVSNQSGQPGDEPTVRVRGIGTTGAAKPLYIVDGLPVSGIDFLNPGDIETIDVLKDAASGAIYGARAANGVILITTKSGTKDKLSVSYNMYYALQNATSKLDMLGADEYKMLMNEGASNSGLSEPFDLQEISSHDTDWQEALFQKNAPMQNHQISLLGGNEKSSFASSFSYFTQEGIIGGSKSQFDRYTGRLNTSHQMNKVFSFGNNLAYTHLVKRGIETNQSFNGAYSGALNLDPLTPVYETDEDILNEYPYSLEPVVQDEDGAYYGISDYVGAEVVNPLALIETDNDETRKDQIVGNVYAQIEPIKNLKYRTSLGIDLAYLMNDVYKPLFFLNGAQLNDNKRSIDKHIERFFTWQWENTLSYEKQISGHTINGLVGTTASEYNYEDLQGFNSGLPDVDPNEAYINLATDTVDVAGGGAVHSALFSFFGRLNYNYEDKYSLTTTLRRDGSSKFGENSRFGVFPSVGLAWVASDEPIFQNVALVNYLKFRASWGLNGNQEIGDYQFISSIIKNRGYGIGTGTNTGSSPLFIENADIRWEESEQYNFGIDVGFFENKLQANIDIYEKTTNGLLEKIAIPGHVGNDGPTANIGSVRNRGIELALNWREVVGKTKYYIGINGAFNNNEMTEIGNTEKVIPGASWAIAGAVTRAEEGEPIAFFWGYKTDGIFQNQTEVFQHINSDGELLQDKAQAGDVRFVDVNGDGKIDEEDRTKIGNPTPDVSFGFNASVERSGFDLSIFLQGTYGNDVFNGTQRQDLRYTNRTVAALDRWTGEGTSNTTPRYAWIDTNNNYRVSDLYIEDGSYIRVKNLQLGYSLPAEFLQKMGAANWRIYISGENLFTFTKYTGVDPEIGSFSNVDENGRTVNSLDIGIDRAIYPQARTIRFGTSLTF